MFLINIMKLLLKIHNIIPLQSIILFSVASACVQIALIDNEERPIEPLVKQILIIISQVFYLISYILCIRCKKTKEDVKPSNEPTVESEQIKININEYKPELPPIERETIQYAIRRPDDVRYHPIIERTEVYNQTHVPPYNNSPNITPF